MTAKKILAHDLEGDEARIHWLSIIFDELGGELESCYARGSMSQERFNYVLRKTASLLSAAHTAGGAKIYSLEN